MKSASFSPEPLESRRLLSVSLTPIPNATIPQGSAAQSVDLSQVFTDTTTGQPDLMFSARSDNTSLLQSSISGSVLTVTAAPNLSGFAHLTLVAVAPDGFQASQVLRIHVTPTQGRTLDVPIGPGRRQFRFVQADHTIGTINLIGPGTGTLVMGGDNLVLLGDHARGANQEIESINLTGTTAATSLVINGVSAKRGRVFAQIGDVTSDGSIGIVRMKKVNLVGDINVAGGTSLINMDLAQNGTILFGQAVGRVQMKIGSFTDENFSTPAPISTLNVSGWGNSDTVPESFQAAAIQHLSSNGSFQPGVQLSGTGVTTGRLLNFMKVGGLIGGTWTVPGASAPLLIGGTAFDFNGTFASVPYIRDTGSFSGTLNIPSLSQLKVNGNMVSALLNLTGAGAKDLGVLNVRGVISGSAIVSAGNLGQISARGLVQSIVYAGVSTLPQGQPLPTSAAELTASASIGSIVTHPTAKVIGFLASDIAASSIGVLNLGTTRVANNGVPFGVAGASIGRFVVRDLTNHRVIALSNINDPTTLANQVAAQRLNLQDLTVTVLT